MHDREANWSDVSDFDRWQEFAAAASRVTRGLVVLLAAILVAACGADASPVPPADEQQQPPEQRDDPGPPEPPAPPDPLDLASCDTSPGALTAGVTLPDLGWDDGGDDHAAMCAFRALDPLLEGRTILCSGENDHGVSETTRWNAALARYLVHRWGVRVIAWESDAASIAHWNRYLETGDAADLEAGFAGTEGTLAGTMEQEYLVETLRQLQAELPEGERLRLTGYDIAVQPGTTTDRLVRFLERVASDEVATWQADLNYRRVRFAQAAASAERLRRQIEDNHDVYVAATDEETWRAARMDAANLRDGMDFLRYYAAGDFATGNSRFREPGMIRNATELAAGLGEGERLLLLGHNGHCARLQPAQGAATVEESPALGTALAQSETWGPQFVVIAQLYERGQHHLAGNPIVLADFDTSDRSLPAALGLATDAPALLVGTDATAPDMSKLWDTAPFGRGRLKEVPAEQYDAVLWVREVTATELR